MVTVHSTAPRTITATITPQTDFNTMDTACVVYHRFNEFKVGYDTLNKVKDAMRDSSAVVTLYADAKGEIAARCLWPNSLTLTRENAITCKAYCTLRREWRSFRLDRMIACHALTTPDVCEMAA